MKIKLIIIMLIIGFINVEASGFRKYAGEFLSAGVGSRALGMGGAFVAVANDVTAGYWNPSGLVSAQGLQFQFMHAKQFLSSIQYDYFGASRSIGEKSVFGLSMIRWGVNDIKDTRNALNGASLSDGLDYSKISSFNIADYVFYVSYAHRYTADLSVGANVKIIYRDYASETAMGIGFDAGVQVELIPDLTLGLMVRDLTSTMMAWSTNEKEFVVPSFRPGVTYRFDFKSVDLYIQPAMDLAVLLESRNQSAQFGWGVFSVDTFWGMEAGFKDLCFLRLGYDDLSRFNAGLGVAIKKFGVDYSYTSFDNVLGNVHRISFYLRLDT